MTSLSTFITAHMGITPEDKPLAISGRNWGDAVLEGQHFIKPVTFIKPQPTN